MILYPQVNILKSLKFEPNPKSWTYNWRGFIIAKLTHEDKKEIIRLYNEEHLGYESISKKIMISTKVVERIITKFHMHGEDALKKKKVIIVL